MSTTSTEVFAKSEEPEQLELLDLGAPVARETYTFRFGPPMETDPGLKMHRRVKGSWAGMVMDEKAKTTKDGDVVVNWTIVLDSVEIE